VARLDAASQATQGGEADLFYAGARIHLSDPESGKSLLAGRGTVSNRKAGI